MDTLCHVWPVTCLGRSAHVFGQSQQNHDVLSFRGGERVVLCGRNHPCLGIKRQPRFLQIHLSDNGFSEANELFLGTAYQMRQGKMHPLRQVPEGLPNGCGSQPQCAQPKERHRVHPLPKVQESLSC